TRPDDLAAARGHDVLADDAAVAGIAIGAIAPIVVAAITPAIGRADAGAERPDLHAGPAGTHADPDLRAGRHGETQRCGCNEPEHEPFHGYSPLLGAPKGQRRAWEIVSPSAGRKGLQNGGQALVFGGRRALYREPTAGGGKGEHHDGDRRAPCPGSALSR